MESKINNTTKCQVLSNGILNESVENHIVEVPQSPSVHKADIGEIFENINCETEKKQPDYTKTKNCEPPNFQVPTAVNECLLNSDIYQDEGATKYSLGDKQTIEAADYSGVKTTEKDLSKSNKSERVIKSDSIKICSLKKDEVTLISNIPKNLALNAPDMSYSNSSINDLFSTGSSEAISGGTKIKNSSLKNSEKETLINPNPEEFDMVQKENNLSDNSKLLFNPKSSMLLPCSDDSVVITNCNAFLSTENIVSSNSALSQLCFYGSDESLDTEPHLDRESSSIGKIPLTESEQPIVASFFKDSKMPNYYRNTNQEISDRDSDSDSSSSSSSSLIFCSDSSSDSESDDELENLNPKPPPAIKGKGELDLKDLPPIEDLKISVPEDECTPVGKVFQIVDQLVVIEAIKDTPALNLDTVLFLQGGQPLGKIFDVLGPVAEPYYCVRFNSRQQIEEKEITLNQVVYCAPKLSKYTNYVFLAQLLKLKGSDASWVDDEEPPEIFLDYSDDEQEQRAKKKKSFRKQKALAKSVSDPDEPARKKHFAYERKMNKRNLQLSEIRKNIDSNTNNRQAVDKALPECSRNVFNQAFGSPPVFYNRAPGGTPNMHENMNSALSSSFQPNYFQPNPPRFNLPSSFLPGNSNPPSTFNNPWIQTSPHTTLPNNRQPPFSPPALMRPFTPQPRSASPFTNESPRALTRQSQSPFTRHQSHYDPQSPPRPFPWTDNNQSRFTNLFSSPCWERSPARNIRPLNNIPDPPARWISNRSSSSNNNVPPSNQVRHNLPTPPPYWPTQSQIHNSSQASASASNFNSRFPPPPNRFNF